MKSALLFNFTVDKSTNTINVSREFAASQQLLWDSFTKQELLDKWWAPKPWKSKTSVMNFEEGGKRIYAMCGPEGEEHWAIQSFTSISPIKNFQFEDAFSDKDGNTNPTLPAMLWNLDFSGVDNSSKVDIEIKLNSLEQLEQIIQMGFKEGFTMTLNYLEEMIASV